MRRDVAKTLPSVQSADDICLIMTVQGAVHGARRNPAHSACARGSAVTSRDAAVTGHIRGQPGVAAEPGATGHAPGGSRCGRVAAVLRRHGLVCALLAAGLVLRLLSSFAYRPALVYIDSLKYLYGANPGTDPLGYRLVLRAVANLETVAVLQHLAGLGMGVVLYAVLVRRGTARWLAALAVAPVLLDAYELQIEQMVMPDVWFFALIVAGLAVLLWQPAVSLPFAAVAGLLLGASATVRALGELLIVPALVYLLVAWGGWRRALSRAAALAVAFALPILCYCSYSYAETGHFWLARAQSTNGRLAAAADCATLQLPAAVRPLCPTPAEQALGPDWLEHSPRSPLFAAPVPPGSRRGRLIAALETAVEHQQPWRVAASIARDSVRLFALTRTPTPWTTPIGRWQFQAGYPVYPPWISLGRGNVIVVGVEHLAFGPFRYYPLSPAYGGQAQVNRPVAALLRRYQLRGGFTPGPLLALCALAGVAGSLVALLQLRAGSHSRGLALACLLFTATAATVLLVPDTLEFSWRYQLPALITLPPAGALGAAAVRSVWASRSSARTR